MKALLLVACCYFTLNLVCALLLHLHGLRQAHLPLRVLDIVMHFVLLSAIAIPVLLLTTAKALFGREPPNRARSYQPVHQGR